MRCRLRSVAAEDARGAESVCTYAARAHERTRAPVALSLSRASVAAATVSPAAALCARHQRQTMLICSDDSACGACSPRVRASVCILMRHAAVLCPHHAMSASPAGRRAKQCGRPPQQDTQRRATRQRRAALARPAGVGAPRRLRRRASPFAARRRQRRANMARRSMPARPRRCRLILRPSCLSRHADAFHRLHVHATLSILLASLFHAATQRLMPAARRSPRHFVRAHAFYLLFFRFVAPPHAQAMLRRRATPRRATPDATLMRYAPLA